MGVSRWVRTPFALALLGMVPGVVAADESAVVTAVSTTAVAPGATGWAIVADPFGNLPLSAAVAALPILYLFWALAWRRMKGHWASLSTLGLALAIAIIGYGMPAKLAVLASLDGVLFGLWPISWIILPALFIFNLSVKTGDFEVIKNSLAVITDDRRMQALLVAFSFGAFLEGCAGFGTPVAITAAVLIGLGFQPLQAAGICLLANTAPVAFGAIGIPIIVAGQVSGVDAFAISQMAGRTLPFITVLIPFYIVILISGWRNGFAVWPAAVVSGCSFALAQWATANCLGPMLPDIIASVVSIVSLTVFLRFWHPKQSWTFAHEAAASGKAALRYRPGQVLRAWAPFVILTVFVAGWGVQSLRDALDHYALIKLPIAGLDQQVIRDGAPLAAVYKLNLLSAAGTAVLLAGLCAVFVTRASPALAVRTFIDTATSMRWPVVGIAAILGFAYIMNFSGMATTLGVAFATTGQLFPFFAAFLGWLGVFMTGSDTSANALFGKLQQETAVRIGIDPVITVSANSVGGVCGKMISPQSLAVASAAVGLVGREGDIFRFTIVHSLILTTLVGVMVYLHAYVLTWMVPTTQVAAISTGIAGNSASAGLIYLAVTLGAALAISVVARRVGAARL